jgi:hypothetical protein
MECKGQYKYPAKIARHKNSKNKSGNAGDIHAANESSRMDHQDSGP